MADSAPGYEIAKLLLKGLTRQELLKQGFKLPTIKDWEGKLEKKGKAGLFQLLSEEGVDLAGVTSPQAPAGDGGKPQASQELKPAAKDLPPPPEFFIKVTLRLEGDNLFFYYRAKQGGYPGDMSDFFNSLTREALQIRGYRMAAVMDPDMAQKVLQQCTAGEGTDGGQGHQ